MKNKREEKPPAVWKPLILFFIEEVVWTEYHFYCWLWELYFLGEWCEDNYYVMCSNSKWSFACEWWYS